MENNKHQNKSKIGIEGDVFQGGVGRLKSNAAYNYLSGVTSSSEEDENGLTQDQKSKILYQQVDINDITPRPINRYSQTRINRLAKSIKATNNRLIHPIVLARPGDLKSDSPTLKRFEENNIDVKNIKYMIVAGERRFHAWMQNFEETEKEFAQKGVMSAENPFATITANILTPEEAKNEEKYYRDSNDEARQLTPIEGLMIVKDAEDEIKTNEDKRNALIEMNGGNEEGIDPNPDIAAKKFNSAKFAMYYLEQELGIVGWKESTVKQYTTIAKNCSSKVIDAIISGEYPSKKARYITQFTEPQQNTLLGYYLNGKHEEYEDTLAAYQSNVVSEVKKGAHIKTGKDVTRTYDGLKARNSKTIKELEDLIKQVPKVADKEKAKQILKLVQKFDKALKELNEE